MVEQNYLRVFRPQVQWPLGRRALGHAVQKDHDHSSGCLRKKRSLIQRSSLFGIGDFCLCSRLNFLSLSAKCHSQIAIYNP
jgi:hypothetical protein